MALLEVCCGNLESVDAAVLGGARRIELCSDLEVDGLTPPAGWIRTVKARYPSLTVHVLIRPRAGDFRYDDGELDDMVRQAETALDAGADGIVTGCLTENGDIDIPAMERILRGMDGRKPSRKVSVTFHRAFDVCRRPFEAMERVIGLGCARILTSGQRPSVTEGIGMIRELRRRADGRILLLPGGGVTPDNAAQILSLTGCTEIHASASETLSGKKVTSAARVAAILTAIEST